MIQQDKTDLHGLALAAVVSAWCGGIFLSSLVALPPLILLISAGITLILIALLWPQRRERLIFFLTLFLLLGASRYTIALPTNDPQAISTYIGENVLEVRGTIADEPKLAGNSRMLTVTVSQISRNQGKSWQDADGKMTIRARGTMIESPYGANYGDTVEVQGKLQLPELHSPPDIFASMLFPRISVTGVGGNPILALLYHLRVVCAGIIAQSLPQPEAALLIAILLSMRTPSLRGLIPAFNATGTAHLIAPSGFKVTILAGLVANSMSWFYKKQGPRKRTGSIWQDGYWRQWLGTLLIVMSVVAYTILSGAGAAALRAGIMGILLVIAPRIGRIYNIYTALALTALMMTLGDPFLLWDAGFQLSFIGTLGIVLLTPFFQRLLHPIERLPLGHAIAEIIAVTLAAQIATLPIFAVTFQEISFIAPLANILTVPLLGTMIVLGTLISGLGILFAPLGVLGGWAAWPILWYVTSIIPWCASLPGAFITVSNFDSGLAWSYYALLHLLTGIGLKKGKLFSQATPKRLTDNLLPGLSRRTWHRMQLGMALLVMLATAGATLFPSSNGNVTIAFLSVGPSGEPAQGEAILVRTPDNKSLLIDGGIDIPSLAQALDSRFPLWQRSLDVVLLTATKSDHITGLQDIIQRYQVGEVIDAGMLHPTTTYAMWRRTISERNFSYIPVAQGTTIPIGIAVVLQILWPMTPLHKGSDEVRDNGLIVRLVTPQAQVLLLGEAAQSKYALTGLLKGVDTNYLQAGIVQIVGETSKPYPRELSEVLQKAHPAWLIVTPATFSAKQRKVSASSGLVPATRLPDLASGQILQTSQIGTIEISNGETGWNMNTM